MNGTDIGKFLIVAGIVLAVVGVAVYAGGRFGFLNLGRLPGDIYVERENFRFHFPIVTCIIVSIVLSAILYLVSRFR